MGFHRAGRLLCSLSLTKWTSSGCPIEFNKFLLQTSDDINEGDLKTAYSKPRIIYCPSSVMEQRTETNQPRNI